MSRQLLRMWMVPPEKMCDTHLVKEHVDIHFLVCRLAIRKGGEELNAIVESKSIIVRHNELEREMGRRGLGGSTPLISRDVVDRIMFKMTKEERERVINREESHKLLCETCSDCKERKNGISNDKGQVNP